MELLLPIHLSFVRGDKLHFIANDEGARAKLARHNFPLSFSAKYPFGAPPALKSGEYKLRATFAPYSFVIEGRRVNATRVSIIDLEFVPIN